jgi:hypothetical protein
VQHYFDIMPTISEQLVEAIHSFNLLFAATDYVQPAAEQKTNVISEDFDDSKESCIRRIGQFLSVIHDSYTTEMKRSTLLQEFLINELNHTEELGSELRHVREELNIAVKQRENFKKKCESQLAELEMLTSCKSMVGGNAGLSSGSGPDATPADTQAMLLEMRLLGKFVGKNFPGIQQNVMMQCLFSSSEFLF